MQTKQITSWDIHISDKGRSVQEKLFEYYGLPTEKQQDFFLNSDPREHIHDPMLLPDMEKACKRLEKAIKDGERIVVFGDYDADGVTATACLVRTLTLLGAKVSYRIPHRIKDGYSLKDYFLDELHKLEVTLVITVDNGIAAAREIAHANDLGMDIIVTDHHTAPPADQMPIAHAIVNPLLLDSTYPFRELSGSAVSMKVCIALLERNMEDEEKKNKHIDILYQIASIGLVADLMPLRGENRAIVQLGLDSLAHRPLPGIVALAKVAGFELERITAKDIGFQIGPRINAAGRLDSAYLALNLFLNSAQKVEQIAKELHDVNEERKTITLDFYDQALGLLHAEGNFNKPIQIVASPDWNSGINGLVASRLTQNFARPSIALSRKGDVYVGSCRSIPEFNIIEALQGMSHYFLHFGGHPGAAGVSIHESKYEAFVQEITEVARKSLESYDFVKRIGIVCDVQEEELSWELQKLLSKFEPFGKEFEPPLFALRNIQLVEPKGVGQEGAHLSFTLPSGVRGIGFGFGELAKEAKQNPVDLAVSLGINYWNGKSYLQLYAEDVQLVA